jgi:hypothetical protein
MTSTFGKCVVWVLLNPFASLLAMILAWWYADEWSFVVKTSVGFIGVLVYIALRPRPKRNKALWQSLGATPADRRVQRELGLAVRNNAQLETRTTPMIVFSYEIKESPIGCSKEGLLSKFHCLCQHDASGFLDHAFAFATQEFDSIPALYVGDTTTMDSRGRISGKCTDSTWWFGTAQLTGALPLVRITLHLLGGIMQYSRPLLMQLIHRKSRAAVILQRPIRNHSANFKQKGVFAAALKSGALIVPVIVDRRGRGEVIVGTPISTTKTDVPTAEEVRSLAVTFGTELKGAYQKLTREQLVLVDL